MSVSQITGDHTFAGTIKFNQAPTLPEDCVGGREFDVSDPLPTSHQYHRHNVCGGEASGSAGTSYTKAVHVANAPGTVQSFAAGVLVAAAGAATYTLDLKKNGTTVLSAVITLDSANVINVVESGAIVSSGVEDYVAGDVFTVVTVATAGGGTLPQGVYFRAVFDEEAS
jgi:hypothetical protein